MTRIAIWILASCGAAPGRLFGPDHPWNQPVDGADLDERFVFDNSCDCQRVQVEE